MVNALLLRNVLALSPDLGHVPAKDLLALLANRLLETNAARASGSDEAALNLRRAIDEAVDRLPTLADGPRPRRDGGSRRLAGRTRGRKVAAARPRRGIDAGGPRRITAASAPLNVHVVAAVPPRALH